MISWRTSFFPHKCSHCRNRIKRKTPHVVIRGFGDSVNGRYCDPQCAYLAKEAQRKRWEEQDRLKRIIDGGEE